MAEDSLRGGLRAGTAVLPGSLASPFRGGPIGVFDHPPTKDVLADMAVESLDDTDGFILVVAVVPNACLVLSATGKLGWVDPWDLGVGSVAGSVYSTR